MLGDYFQIAIRNIRGKRLRSWLTLLGILIGIAAVVSLIGLGDAMRSAILSQFSGVNVDVLTVTASSTISGPPGAGVIEPLTKRDADVVEGVLGVSGVGPRFVQQVRVEYNDQLRVRFVGSMPDGDRGRTIRSALNWEIEQGRDLRDRERRSVTVGYGYSQQGNGFDRPVRVGDRLVIEDEVFTVVGIYKRQGSFIFDNVLVMNEDTLRDLVGVEQRYDTIFIQVRDISEIDQVRASIEQALRRSRGVREGDENFQVETPQSILDNLNDILLGVQVFIIVIASISIIVGSIGIVNTMLTAVLERRSQIGVMKSVGARNSDIFFLFFIESGIMGLIGGVVGAIIGAAITISGTVAINNFLGVEAVVRVDFVVIFASILGSFLIGAFAGVIPALRAARQHPVEALRS